MAESKTSFLTYQNTRKCGSDEQMDQTKISFFAVVAAVDAEHVCGYVCVCGGGMCVGMCGLWSLGGLHQFPPFHDCIVSNEVRF